FQLRPPPDSRFSSRELSCFMSDWHCNGARVEQWAVAHYSPYEIMGWRFAIHIEARSLIFLAGGGGEGGEEAVKEKKTREAQEAMKGKEARGDFKDEREEGREAGRWRGDRRRGREAGAREKRVLEGAQEGRKSVARRRRSVSKREHEDYSRSEEEPPHMESISR
ncbi:unnamed protein product, partial [Pleuronectes platessa]